MASDRTPSHWVAEDGEEGSDGVKPYRPTSQTLYGVNPAQTRSVVVTHTDPARLKPGKVLPGGRIVKRTPLSKTLKRFTAETRPAAPTRLFRL